MPTIFDLVGLRTQEFRQEKQYDHDLDYGIIIMVRAMKLEAKG